MGNIKYRNGEGDFVPLNTYAVGSSKLAQETGDSEKIAMSQAAVTRELDKKLDAAEGVTLVLTCDDGNTYEIPLAGVKPTDTYAYAVSFIGEWDDEENEAGE